MKRRIIIAFSIFLLIILLSVFLYEISSMNADEHEKCYVGVSFGGDTVEQAKLLINRIRNFSNLFILQSGPISTNETATTAICDYATSSGLSIIVYFGDLDPVILTEKNLSWRINWVSEAKLHYGDKFLGVYYYDERGGIYLDADKNATNWHLPSNATYDSVATTFENGFLRDRGTVLLKNENVPIFCSDYALYWFDYISGYDVVFAEAGWNHTLAQDIALARGAATFQHKDWGVMITWKNTQPPYLDNDTTIYDQMVNSYQAGAKYIAIFNFPYDSPYGIMSDNHFDALERFWGDITQNRIAQNSAAAKALLVLPKNYGYGLRFPEDKIWGFWGPDEKSPIIWNAVQTLIERYNYSLDIAYQDSSLTIPSSYKMVYYWNSSIS